MALTDDGPRGLLVDRDDNEGLLKRLS